MQAILRGEQLRLRIKKLEVERDEAQTSLALHLSLKMPVINSERGHERREEEQKDPQKSGNSKESCKDHNETLSLNMPELTVGMAGELEEEEEFFAESAKTWKEIERLQDLENSADYGGRHAYTDLDNEVIVGNDEGFIDHGHRAVEEQMTFEETSGVVTFFAESSRVWKEIEQERSLGKSIVLLSCILPMSIDLHAATGYYQSDNFKQIHDISREQQQVHACGFGAAP